MSSVVRASSTPRRAAAAAAASSCPSLLPAVPAPSAAPPRPRAASPSSEGVATPPHARAVRRGDPASRGRRRRRRRRRRCRAPRLPRTAPRAPPRPPTRRAPPPPPPRGRAARRRAPRRARPRRRGLGRGAARASARARRRALTRSRSSMYIARRSAIAASCRCTSLAPSASRAAASRWSASYDPSFSRMARWSSPISFHGIRRPSVACRMARSPPPSPSSAVAASSAASCRAACGGVDRCRRGDRLPSRGRAGRVRAAAAAGRSRSPRRRRGLGRATRTHRRLPGGLRTRPRRRSAAAGIWAHAACPSTSAMSSRTASPASCCCTSTRSSRMRLASAAARAVSTAATTSTPTTGWGCSRSWSSAWMAHRAGRSGTDSRPRLRLLLSLPCEDVLGTITLGMLRRAPKTLRRGQFGGSARLAAGERGDGRYPFAHENREHKRACGVEGFCSLCCLWARTCACNACPQAQNTCLVAHAPLFGELACRDRKLPKRVQGRAYEPICAAKYLIFMCTCDYFFFPN